MRNAALFDHCNLANMQVVLNHLRYPSVDMPTDFAKEQFVGVYKCSESYCIQITLSNPRL